MKTLARKVEDFVKIALTALSTDRVPIYFSTSFDNEITFPSVCVETETGWKADSPFRYGHRTAAITVSVRSKADDTKADAHDGLAGIVEACLGDPGTVGSSAESVPDFRLVEWIPGPSSTSVEDRIRTSTFTYSSRVRDDNGTANV